MPQPGAKASAAELDVFHELKVDPKRQKLPMQEGVDTLVLTYLGNDIFEVQKVETIGNPTVELEGIDALLDWRD